MKTLIFTLLIAYTAYCANSLDSIITNSTDSLRILSIWAHPDDEVAFMGVLAAKVKARNSKKIDIVALTLKDGNDEECLAGLTSGGTYIYSRGCPCALGVTSCPELMGPFRLQRMKEAKDILKIKNRFFPLDSLIYATDTNRAVDSLYKWINWYKPHVLITHNSAGDYVSSMSNTNKSDHALVSRFVTYAYNRLSKKPKFYVSVFNYRNDSGVLLNQQGVGAPIATDSIASDSLLWNLSKQAGDRYDGSGFYIDINKVGVNYRKNWFYRVDQ
jgi:LmbE family N-acetylglucosaminyl deacetylase